MKIDFEKFLAYDIRTFGFSIMWTCILALEELIMVRKVKWL